MFRGCTGNPSAESPEILQRIAGMNSLMNDPSENCQMADLRSVIYPTKSLQEASQFLKTLKPACTELGVSLTNLVNPASFEFDQLQILIYVYALTENPKIKEFLDVMMPNFQPENLDQIELLEVRKLLCLPKKLPWTSEIVSKALTRARDLSISMYEEELKEDFLSALQDQMPQTLVGTISRHQLSNECFRSFLRWIRRDVILSFEKSNKKKHSAGELMCFLEIPGDSQLPPRIRAAEVASFPYFLKKYPACWDAQYFHQFTKTFLLYFKYMRLVDLVTAIHQLDNLSVTEQFKGRPLDQLVHFMAYPPPYFSETSLSEIPSHQWLNLLLALSTSRHWKFADHESEAQILLQRLPTSMSSIDNLKICVINRRQALNIECASWTGFEGVPRPLLEVLQDLDEIPPIVKASLTQEDLSYIRSWHPRVLYNLLQENPSLLRADADSTFILGRVLQYAAAFELGYDFLLETPILSGESEGILSQGNLEQKRALIGSSLGAPFAASMSDMSALLLQHLKGASWTAREVESVCLALNEAQKEIFCQIIDSAEIEVISEVLAQAYIAGLSDKLTQSLVTRIRDMVPSANLRQLENSQIRLQQIPSPNQEILGLRRLIRETTWDLNLTQDARDSAGICVPSGFQRYSLVGKRPV